MPDRKVAGHSLIARRSSDVSRDSVARRHAPNLEYFFCPRRHFAGWQAILQGDAHAAFVELYAADWVAGSITEAACSARFSRKAFEPADLVSALLATEAVRRIDLVFEAER